MSETLVEAWEGAEALRPYLRPIESVVDHVGNPRKGDVEALKGSLRRFGQVRPILFEPGESEDVIVAGHHLRYAARDLGWTHLAMVPHTFADEAERKAYLVADNQLATLAGYDEQAQMSLWSELAEAGALEGTGVSIDAMEDLQARIGVPTTEPQEWAGGYAEDARAAAERAAALAASQQMKEIVLMVSPEQYEEFGRYVRALQKEYGTSGVVATVLRAVGEAAVASTQESAPPPADVWEGTHVVEIAPGSYGDDPDAQFLWRAACACGVKFDCMDEATATEWAETHQDHAESKAELGE